MSNCVDDVGPVYEKLIELKGNSHTCTYSFKKINTYIITGNEETINTFHNQ